MSSTDREWLRSELDATRVSSVLGANDGGAIAYQCRETQGALHHLLDDFNLVEIVDDHGRPLPDGEPGRILITSLLKTAFPLIRYDINDRGRVVPGDCSCGRTTRRIELLGRGGDWISFGMERVRHLDFKNAVQSCRISELQLEVQATDAGDLLIVRVETSTPSPEREGEIRRSLVNGVSELKKAIEERTLAALKIEILPPGGLPRNPRTGKIPAVIDRRL
jgi:phenylacetate-coenzyme A ligase PaaK-like adenylate-forming protein